MSALHKSFGSFEIKSIDEEKRTFTGTASTPNQDRSKDIMVPKGAKFKLPMPFLFHHKMETAVGRVLKAQVTDKGIEVEVEFPDIKEEGDLKREVDKAYQSLKYKLVTGLSVGFIPNWESAEMIKGGGIQFNDWEWYELFKEVDLMVEVPEESKGLLKNIVIDAYKQPVFTDQSFRDRQVVDFANDTHLKCLEIMK